MKTKDPGREPLSALWRWPALCEALGLAAVAGPDVTGVSIDSRRTAPGDLFVALSGDPGPRFSPSQRSDRDGHDFIDAAVAAGAVGVLSHDGQARPVPQLAVADTLDGLWALGRAGRARLQGPVVCVTGSSGKTTVKGLLAAALPAFATEGSLNNHLGVPLSLARTPADVPAAVYEIGTNHPGEIAPLSALARPDVAVVLNVHPAHRANFADLAAIQTEKISIFKGLKPEGQIVLEESLEAVGVPGTLPVLRFGTTTAADVQLLSLSGDQARYRVRGRTVSARVPGGGQHRALSLAAVLTVLLALGRDPEAGLALPADLVPAGRGNRRRAGGVTVLDDSYNANPASMAAALNTLAAAGDGPRYALLGEMLELGDEGPEHHRALVPHCADLDGVFCVGSGMRSLAEALPPERVVGYWEVPDDSLLDALTARLAPGTTLLVKGSNRVFWARGFVDRLLERLSSTAA